MMEKGPHLLAPTGSDLTGANRKAGTVLAGWHNDLNLLTIHGKSRCATLPAAPAHLLAAAPCARAALRPAPCPHP